MADTNMPAARESIYNKDWTQGPIVRNIVLLSWPMALMETLFVVSQVADMVWVGRLGSAAIAGMGVSFSVVLLIMTMDFGLVIGTRAMVARYVGAGDITNANRVAAQGLIITLTWGLLMTILGILLAEPVMAMFRLDASVIAEGVAYMRITFAGWVAMDIMVMILYTVQSSGDAIRPLLLETLTRAIHMTLCPCLVLGLWVFPRMGVGGAALASVIGQVVGAGLAAWLFFGGGTRLHITWKDFQPDFSIIGRILKIGLPSLLTGLQRSFGVLLIAFLMAPFGTMAMAAHGIYSRIELFIFLPGSGLAAGAGVLVGQNLGAGHPERAEKSSWIASVILEGLMIVVSAVLLLWADGIISIFTTDPELIRLGSTFLRIAVAGFTVIAFNLILQGCISGAGDTIANLILGFVAMWVVQIPLAVLLPRVNGLGALGIRWALVAGNIIGSIIYVAYFRLGKWRQKRV